MHAVVLLSINQRKTFKVPSFTYFKDIYDWATKIFTMDHVTLTMPIRRQFVYAIFD